MSPPTRASYRDIPLYAPSKARCRVDLSDNTNLFGLPPAAERVLRETTATQVGRYPVGYSPDLRQAVARYTGMDPAQVTTGCGSDDVIDCTLRAFLEPGELIAYPSPTFVMMSYFAKVNGLRYAPVRLRPDFDIDVDGLLATGAKLIYVCSPNNPTGTVASRAALERLVDTAPGLVLIDEAYAEFARDSHLDLARRPNVLVTRTLSKAFGLAAMRVGYAVGAPGLVAEVEKARGPYKVTGLSERMAVAALTEDVPWMRARADEALAVRARLVEELARLGLSCLPTEANFVMVPLRGAPAVAETMRARDVNVRAFAGLPGIGDALRIGCGPWNVMQAALDALREALP
ncbi:pyridoxal phosphate-dependent aminotransferase [Archangium primigenium]|uniref:pyridoxal phosphate-dependent aminotransferase n=1 Tax=[Archangium] primigenium TaxID=2792470 RepID=UPI0019563371|nr:aminotransferase class I/II-fold pyridoxal phosphate-dependent enzyme [Archangium primigenium]MBM7117401.1 aminotransferase class I/II-fold pyridoxal phosphate-dependent enzyme [Archangium primigenium]